MRLHKANSLHLYLAALYLAPSDRAELDRMRPGRNPQDVLMASSGDPTLRAISDDKGNVLAVGGSSKGCLWFVHTVHADALSAPKKFRMFRLLEKHLGDVKAQALTAEPNYDFHFTNVVSVLNTKHIKLLQSLGAAWGKTLFAMDGTKFRQFYF